MKAFPRRISQPTVEPLTVAEVRHHLHQDDLGDADAALIQKLIKAAREECESRTGRTLINSEWRLTLDAFPDAIELRQPPIIEVLSVQYRDVEGVARILDPQDYVLDNAREPGWLVPAPGRSWPGVGDGINAVTVDYVAGYGETGSDVPEPLNQWMLLNVAQGYQVRKAGSEKPQVFHDYVDTKLHLYIVYG